MLNAIAGKFMASPATRAATREGNASPVMANNSMSAGPPSPQGPNGRKQSFPVIFLAYLTLQSLTVTNLWFLFTSKCSS